MNPVCELLTDYDLHRAQDDVWLARYLQASRKLYLNFWQMYIQVLLI